MDTAGDILPHKTGNLQYIPRQMGGWGQNRPSENEPFGNFS